MKLDQINQEAFEETLRRVARAIASELEHQGDVVDLDSLLRAITPRGPHVLDNEALADTKKKISAIKSALKTLERTRYKLKNVGINTGPISEVEGHYHLLLALKKFVTGADKLSTNGGVNWPAREVARMVARAFTYHGAKVTFGTKPDGTGPSTSYGRAVELALRELNIKADWRRAAEFGLDVVKELDADMKHANTKGTYR